MTGAIGGQGNDVESAVMSGNSNAAPPLQAVLQPGNNTIVLPSSTYTINALFMRPPSTSTNAKTVKAATGDSNTGAWTSQFAVVPVAGLSTIVVYSTSTEAIDIRCA
jgi:hypothetical protein